MPITSKRRLATVAAIAATTAAAAIVVAPALAQPRQGNGQDRNVPDWPTASDQRPIVTVSGEGIISLEPDRAIIRVGATAQAENADDAQSTVNETVAQITEDVRKLDIPGTIIQTRGLNLGPVYSRPDNRSRNANNEPRITGYRASLTIELTIDDVPRAGDAIDAALAAGANQLQGITFTIADDSEAERRALKEAVTDARAKADAIAQALGNRVARLVEVTESGAQPWMPQPRKYGMERSMVAADRAPTPIEAGELEVRASVQMTFQLAD